jgi:hypothetical protein
MRDNSTLAGLRQHEIRDKVQAYFKAMTARVMKPGCKQDHALVLSWLQGQNKSTACRVLAGGECFSDMRPSIRGDKFDAIRHLQGKWLVEPHPPSQTSDLRRRYSHALAEQEPDGQAVQTGCLRWSAPW